MKKKQKKSSNIYLELKRIEQPVMLLVDAYHDSFDRIRILHPDGRCYFSFLGYINGPCYMPSCFGTMNITNTIREMQQHDNKCSLKIVGVIKL